MFSALVYGYVFLFDSHRCLLFFTHHVLVAAAVSVVVAIASH